MERLKQTLSSDTWLCYGQTILGCLCRYLHGRMGKVCFCLNYTFYLRYLDDIFGLWLDTEASFFECIALLNAHHPKIRLKYNLQKRDWSSWTPFITPVLGSNSIKLANKTNRLALLFKGVIILSTLIMGSLNLN